jgi:diguanylate cyclase (GGDEF)-like protein/PAS domain S-box-containing protein
MTATAPDPVDAGSPARTARAGAFAAAPVAMLLLTADARAFDANPAWCELAGLSVTESTALGWLDVLAPRDRARLRRLVRDPARIATALDTPLVDRASARWARWLISAAGRGAEPAVLVTVLDVTGEHDERERLQHEASHDQLTGAANRRLFLEAARHALARLGRHAGSVGVLFVDLDGFKDVNDRHGHHTGDDVLAAQAQRPAEVLRPADVLARVGGDEFAVLCQDLSGADHLASIADRIARRLARPVPVGGGNEASAPASVGGVVTAASNASAAALLDAADQAMYRAKRSRSGPVVVVSIADHPEDGSTTMPESDTAAAEEPPLVLRPPAYPSARR